MNKINDFRKPVEYVIDQKLRKLKFKDGVVWEDLEEVINELPEYPVDIIREDIKTEKVTKLIYDKDGVYEWTQTIIRDFTGKVRRIKVELPNELEYYIDLVRDEKKITRVELNS